jgi:hypothetical protein
MQIPSLLFQTLSSLIPQLTMCFQNPGLTSLVLTPIIGYSLISCLFTSCHHSLSPKRCWCPWWSCRYGETTSLNCGNHRVCCASPRWHMGMEDHDGMVSTGENWFVHQSSLKIIPAESYSSKAGGNLRRKLWIWPVKYLCSYYIGQAALITPQKEGVLLILIALKSTTPWPDLNPRTLGTVASTQITTPPRRLSLTLTPVLSSHHKLPVVKVNFFRLYQWTFQTRMS